MKTKEEMIINILNKCNVRWQITAKYSRISMECD